MRCTLPRPLRLDVAGGVYHVIARGNERKPIFRDDEDRKTYLKRLADCRERFQFRIYAYCLMSNHVHLALERGPVALSRIMLALQSFYSQRFNARHCRVGHLFQGRYKSFLVERERYLFALLRYLHLNPVKAGIVPRPQDYRWSSDQFYRAGAGPPWLDLEDVLRMLAPRRSWAVAGYRRLVDGRSDLDYDEATAIGAAVQGSDEFAERVLQQQERIPCHGTRSIWTIESIVEGVATALGVPVRSLNARRRCSRAARVRTISAYLGRVRGGIPVSRTARYLGRDESTVVRAVLRLECAIAADRRQAAEVQRIWDLVRAGIAGMHG